MVTTKQSETDVMEEFTLIDNQQQLNSVCTTLLQSSFIAIDTEFMREKTYFPQLAFIQIADDAGRIYCIDPLQINDFAPLEKILFNAQLPKVFHSARQDLEIFYHLYGAIPTPIFDTQIAAAFLGHGEQINYAGLIQNVLGVSLDKSHTRTDWLRRPLSKAQVSYAVNDVKYLARAYPNLIGQLDELERTHWVNDETMKITDITLYDIATEECWKKIKGTNQLKGVQLAILQKLAAFRERLAMKTDVPRKRVIPDQTIIDIVRMSADSIDSLKQVRSLSHGFIKTHGSTLIDLINEARGMPSSAWPVAPRIKTPSNDQKLIADILMYYLRSYAENHRIAPSMLTSKKDIDQLVRGNQDIPLLQGWRKECCGEKLMQLLNGKVSITVTDGHIRISDS